VATKTAAEATGLRGDEEAFLWATASLGEARRDGRERTAALLQAVVEELAFGLGARAFPPVGARATHDHRRRWVDGEQNG
jgi:hypothetical protein